MSWGPINGMGGGAISIASDHRFLDMAAADSYFLTTQAHRDTLYKGSYIFIETTKELKSWQGVNQPTIYSNINWRDETTVITGPSGQDGVDGSNALTRSSIESTLTGEITSHNHPSDNTKVDKVLGKGLSSNDFTDEQVTELSANTAGRHAHANKSVLDTTTASYTEAEKIKLSNLNSNFLGAFSSLTACQYEYPSPTNGQYFMNAETSTLWYYENNTWNNSGTSSAGDMLKSVYDPQNIVKDSFDRANHTGTQLLSTIGDVTVTATEVNMLNGVDNNVQLQFDTIYSNQATLSGYIDTLAVNQNNMGNDITGLETTTTSNTSRISAMEPTAVVGSHRLSDNDINLTTTLGTYTLENTVITVKLKCESHVYSILLDSAIRVAGDTSLQAGKFSVSGTYTKYTATAFGDTLSTDTPTVGSFKYRASSEQSDLSLGFTVPEGEDAIVDMKFFGFGGDNNAIVNIRIDFMRMDSDQEYIMIRRTYDSSLQ